ncbi:DNA topoisomerase 3 [Cytophagaceae bacterium DM2B3-1]|uniref:DNA topoisomerase n=1 Tax=Xanthocytophaga flava TaxID=3048013 RepID=A0ABT7CEF0_9BACT|nr:DNA topoisomerase 3 [Xanthocytophaga flavus]MDJ1468933.1 DNA topoisomerase 3 [Xanthocytophaga flavus]MDJ1492107.1 DNA topoisomerase 3 [Xanthocytophaga flavus]
MKVCIAEKPSVAKDIAEVIGAKQRKDGYYEGNGYQVTWTFGHFCTLKEPQDYTPEWKSWRLSALPMIPSNFGIKLIDNSGVQKQFGVIETLLKDCEQVINCGDAGQEGELIQRWVLHKAKCKAPVKRLWISSLTEQAIKDGFANLKDSSQFDNLYAAGSARAIGDWLLGINATRLFTTKFGNGKAVLSIGRVQTPTLAMLVQRQKEINAFKSADYWELKTLYREVEFTATIERIYNQERAQKGLEYLLANPIFTVTSFEKKEGKEGNPRLFDLTALQVEANKKYGFSAEITLKHVQNLYEKKFVTYPRVDTTYLSEDLHPKVEGILRSMQYYQALVAPLLLSPIPKLKTVFDNNKVSDHHAIIPTDVLPTGLIPDEKRVYDLIARRFIAVFYPECKISNTTVLGVVGKVEFKATGKQILEPGWREVYANEAKAKKTDEEKKEEDKDEKKEEEERVMPVFTVGESGPHTPRIHQGKTSPPKPYTEATLLRGMETAGKQVENEEMRDLLKENGIGRPSTRANIIETLIKRNYVEKKKKTLLATQMGIDLIDTIQNELLKSAELTGTWEKKLRQIEKGDYELETFKTELIQMVIDLTNEVKRNAYRQIAIAATPTPALVEEEESAKKEAKPKKPKEPKEEINIEALTCPKCKEHLLKKGNSAYGCGNFKVCGFKIPFEVLGKKLTDKHIYDLLSKGKTGKIKGLRIPGSEEETEGKLVMQADFNIGL